MDSFVTRQTRRARTLVSSDASARPAPYHSAASRQLARATAASESPTSSLPASSQDESPAIADKSTRSHDFPSDARRNKGLRFDIDWEHIYFKSTKFRSDRIGYRVRSKQQLRGNARVAPIYGYGADLEHLKPDGKTEKIWLCRDCHLQRSTDDAKHVNSNHHIATHLLKVHRIDVGGGLLPDLDNSIPGNPWEATLQVAGSRRIISHTPWQEEEMQKAFIDWIIIQDQSFLQSSSPETRVMLTWNRVNLLASLPSSAGAISKYIMKTFRDRVHEIVALMATATSKITISMDIWTAANHLSFMGVKAHFTDYEVNQRDLLIGFRNLYGDHTAAAQAQVMAEVMNVYAITSLNFNCFVGNNASNNDARFISALNTNCGLGLTSSHRIRCAGHIINLVVRAIIYGKGVSKFKLALAAAAPKEQFEMFRKKGVVGKVHNFVAMVLGSHKRRETFMAAQRGLKEDNPIWSFGTLNLLKDGGRQMRASFCSDELEDSEEEELESDTEEEGDEPAVRTNSRVPYNPLTDTITEDEWEEVERLSDFLVHFYEMTRRLEGNQSKSAFGSLWQTITNLQHLDDVLREMIKETEHNPKNSYLRTASRFGLEKLTTYWIKLVMEPEISYYTIATILHPSLRLAWFQDHWRHHTSWYKKAEASMRTAFDSYLEGEDEDIDEIRAPVTRRKVPGGTVHEERFSQTMSVDLTILTGD